MQKLSHGYSYADIREMPRITVRELYRRGADLIDEVDAGQPLLVTRNGRPIAVLAPITDPALKRRKALEVVPDAERAALSWSGPPAADVPLPDVELDEMGKTMLAEIAWFGGRQWQLSDRVGMEGVSPALVRLGALELKGLITGTSGLARLTRLGARFADERLGAEFIERAGRESKYGWTAREMGYADLAAKGYGAEGG